MQSPPIPRLPVFGWSTFSGAAEADMPCVLSSPGLTYTTSGRASILLALEALGVGAGDEVLVPTYHCPTMVAPVVHLRATPRFYPIDTSAAPSWDWLQSQDLSGVRVLLVAHFFGLPQPLAALRHWCDERGIALLEDCAHALFGRSGDRPVGAWGDIAIASLTKFLPMSAGGGFIANAAVAPPKLADTSTGSGVRILVDAVEVATRHRRLTGLNRLVSTLLGSARLLRSRGAAKILDTAQDSPPNLEELGSIDATLAHRALPAIGRWMASRIPRSRIVELRRRRYLQFAQQLSGHAGLRPLMPNLPAHSAPYVFPLWVDHPDPGYAQLRARRMPVSRWDWLWPGVPQIDGDRGVVWSRHVLQLACHQDLAEAEVDAFVQVLLQLYRTAAPARSPVVQVPQVLQGT